jgi:hypothetical protein
MDKDRAASLEGTMRGLRMLLEGMADHVRESFPEHQQQRAMRKLGNALGGLYDISRMIYDEHPDLDPCAEETRLSAAMRNMSLSSKRPD